MKLALEPELEPHLNTDSYGYRPGKSAHQALAVTRSVAGGMPGCWNVIFAVYLTILITVC
ncbi:MAG: hypothetical protein WD672_06195 [Woeseia sp.]